jgi:WD40 repeat protein
VLLSFDTNQARYHPDSSLNNRFYLTLGGDHAGFLYDCSFEAEFALAEWPLGVGPRATQEEDATPPSAVSLRYNANKDLIITGSDDGSVSVRSVSCPHFFARLLNHDGDRGHVISAITSYDDAFLLSAGTDGLLVVSNLRKDTLTQEAQARQVLLDKEAEAEAAAAEAEAASRDPYYVYMKEDPEEGSTAVLPGFVHVESSTKAAQEELPDAMVRKAVNADITDPAAYSIQDAKLKVRQQAAEV